MTKAKYERLVTWWRIATAAGFFVGSAGSVLMVCLELYQLLFILQLVSAVSMLSLILLVLEQVVSNLNRRANGRFTVMSLFYVTFGVAVLAAIARYSWFTAIATFAIGFLVYSISLEAQRNPTSPS